MPFCGRFDALFFKKRYVVLIDIQKLMIEFTYLHEITDTWTNSSN